MSRFGDAFDLVSDVFGGAADTSFDAWDSGGLGESVTGAASSGGGFFDSVGSWLGDNAGGIAKSAFGAAAGAMGGGSGTASRSSTVNYKLEYPAAQSQKAGDAGTPRGLRSVDPDQLARMWMSKMDTLGSKYK